MENIRSLVEATYGYLFEEKLIDEILDCAQEKRVNQGEILINYGQTISHMPLLLDGALKILRQDENFEELLLYFLERGDTCTMTLNCCIGKTKSEISAVAESDVYLLLIPVAQMDVWLSKFVSWRKFVFENYNQRFNEMLDAIDNLAFKNMYSRLLNYLIDKAIVNKSTFINATHQEIANDLNSSRVVISRLLKALEKEKLILLARNKIEMLNLDSSM